MTEDSNEVGADLGRKDRSTRGRVRGKYLDRKEHVGVYTLCGILEGTVTPLTSECTLGGGPEVSHVPRM